MNPWKAFALIMIGLLVVVAGIRLAYVEGHVFRLNDEQKAFAIDAAKDALETDGSGYNITVHDRGRIISTGSGDKKVVLVAFTGANTTLSALVDMDSGIVVEKSRVERSGWMTEYRNPRARKLFLR